RYVVSGATGAISVPYDTVPLRVTAQGIEITTSGTPHRFIRFTMPTAAQVAGRWCLEDGPCLRLGADGRFQDEGAARVLEHATYDYPETPERGEGAFALQDHTLILRYDRGPEVRIAAPGVFDGSPGELREWRLSFNQDLLVRR
ncbi:MAG TPA: hypothetical protein VFV33_12640, partial [Gemmatimonadaceae bacterium]|nr:hypothetical protein [Gemmatimonadaceae bacterium]